MTKDQPTVTVTFREVPLGRLRELLKLVREASGRWQVSVRYELEK